MHIIGRFALVVALCAACALAQDWEREVRALRPASVAARERALLDYLQNRAQLALDAIPQARTPAQADSARPLLRAQLEQSLGFPTVTGRWLCWPGQRGSTSPSCPGFSTFPGAPRLSSGSATTRAS